MKVNRVLALLVAFASIALPGCSYLPSMPWSGSTVSDPTAEALFAEGMDYFKREKYVLAIDRFQRLKSDFPFSPQLTEAELRIADSYYLNKEYAEAITAFKEFQSLHPANEHIPFVILRLGQAHFDQFTAVDRDQKNTEIAKAYFETVVRNHPKSPYADKARVLLAKCTEYLAEHEFQIASFYLQQEKYLAARERFEEIIRRYAGTPTAVKSLYYLGEAYRQEKNSVKAALAYEALIQHYPESKFVGDAKNRLTQIEKEQHDPLAMLLIPERRPGYSQSESLPDPTQTKNLNELNMIAKTEVVYEEPGAEKGFFGRMVDTLNPFSSSDHKEVKKSPEPKPESPKEDTPSEGKSGGFFAALWRGLNPFSGEEPGNKTKDEKNRQGGEGAELVNRIDDSLKQQGIEPAEKVAVSPPKSDLPKVEQQLAAPAPDTKKLIGEIDSNLKKEGKNVAGLPPPPEPAPVLNTPRSEVEAAERAAAKPPPQSPPVTSGLLGSIDQKLKTQGIEPPKVEVPPPAAAKETAPKKAPPQAVELEPKLATEKGPLYLGSEELPSSETQAKTGQGSEAGKQTKDDSNNENH